MNEDLMHGLTGVGLSRDEARAYLNLIRHGASSAATVAKALRISRPRAYRVLEGLTEAGSLVPQVGRPRLFLAVPPVILFKTIELRANAHLERIHKARRDLVPLIEALRGSTPEASAPTFSTLRSADVLFSQAQELCAKARHRIDIAVAEPGGRDLLQSTGFGAILAASARHGTAIHLLAEGRSPELDALMVQVPALNARIGPPAVLPTCIIADRKETVVLVTGKADPGSTLLALRTSVAHFVATYGFLFDGLWKDAPILEPRLAARKPSPRQTKMIRP